MPVLIWEIDPRGKLESSVRTQWDTLLTEYPTDIVLIPGDSAAYSLMRLYPGWVLVYEDTTASLFVRDQSPLIAPIREAAVLPISSREASFP